MGGGRLRELVSLMEGQLYNIDPVNFTVFVYLTAVVIISGCFFVNGDVESSNLGGTYCP